MSDKLTAISEQEFEAGVRRLVEQEFAAVQGRWVKTLPDDLAEAPFTGDEFDPHDAVSVSSHKQRAVRALIAQRWFEDEVPRSWGLSLPLRMKDCQALFNGRHQGQRRSGLVGEYAIHLRGAGWNLQYVEPFEVFCAGVLRG
jgi:hypothetical protein